MAGTSVDQCVFLEAVTGDGGNHTAAVWWLSPDIILNGGTNQADPGGSNFVEVRVHGQGCELISSVLPIDVFVGDPSLVMTPTSNTTPITNVPGRPFVMTDVSTVLASSPPGLIVPFTWINGGTTVEGPGHKCLIARCDPGPTSSTTFDLPSERHVAQRNITILSCSPSCDLIVNTANPNPKASEIVMVRAIADTQPEKHVLKAVRTVLKGAADFKRIRTTELPRFRLEFKRFPNARTTNNTGKPSAKGNYGRLKVPNCEARFEMKGGQRTKFKFLVDLEEARLGDAFVFHLMHINAKKHVIGGLTVVAVRTSH